MKQPEPHDPEFETHLRQQPMRNVPPEWRAEILAHARAAVKSPAARLGLTRQPLLDWLSTLHFQLSSLLWPSPKAWAGLAAAWLVLLTLNHSLITSNAGTASVVSMSKKTLMIGREEQRLLAELIGPAIDSATADRPKPGVPKPRSELHSKLLNA